MVVRTMPPLPLLASWWLDRPSVAGGWPNPRQEQGDLPGAAAACTLPTLAKVERESRGRALDLAMMSSTVGLFHWIPLQGHRRNDHLLTL